MTAFDQPRVLYVLAAAFGIAAALIFVAGLIPGWRAKTSELWALYGTEFVIVAGVLVPAAFGGLVFLAALLIFLLRSQWELFALFESPPFGANGRAAMIAGVALFATILVFRDFAIAAGLAVVLAAGAMVAARKSETRLAAATLLYPALPLLGIAALRAVDNGFAWIVIVYGTVEIADAAALIAGKLIGRAPLLPRLSPRKTFEGLIAGIAVGAGAGLLLAQSMLDLALGPALLVVVTALAAGVAGDLLTSAIKRLKDKKDFIPVLGQHGGILDIYNSFLLAGPAVYFLLVLGLVG